MQEIRDTLYGESNFTSSFDVYGLFPLKFQIVFYTKFILHSSPSDTNILIFLQ